ncbi:MAG: error-prone DNA polymerase [Egibacteraceae bacterium]
MGRHNPRSGGWSQLAQRLSGDEHGPTGDGGDSPAWSRKRTPFTTGVRRQTGDTPYAELHCHSNFSFLDGASHPEELAEEAARLGLEALALTDHDGVYGVVRFAEAAGAVGLPTVFGAELSLGVDAPQNGVADPAGRHLVVLARDARGYARLCRAITSGQMAGEKGAPRIDLASLAELAGGHWLVMTGCRKGALPHALVTDGPSAARRELARLVAAFGREHVAVELIDHGDPLDSHRNDALAEIGVRAGVEVIATNNVHYARPGRYPLAAALAAVRARRSLDELDGWLPASASAHLRSGGEQARRFRRYPGVVERAAELGRACAFDLALIAPNLPDYPVPTGHTEMSWLRELAYAGATQRYGPRHAERTQCAWRQIDHELDMIAGLGYPGYFLIVWDIVGFCQRANILCQGRGSAANSAVCYVIGITKADAVKLDLLFERFLSPERDGPPDIDLDIEADRREEAIQYVYERYGRDKAAQVCNVITYRPKSAVRDMAKALGHSPGQADAWSKQVDPWEQLTESGDHGIPGPVADLATELQGFPRHLGIHSGGMVICDRPVIDVCPVERARMEGRTVLQWDKDDCAATGLVKFDLLGLGMLSVLHYAIDLIAGHHGDRIDLADLPQDDAVYEMLCRADSVGVFQVESRAQMSALPRLRPRTFYDLVVQVGIIRPGPIQGGSVHPYIRRRNGKEPVSYLHPLLERSLRRTLGVPLFQEQLMQMAVDVAGFTAAEADQLRQAMSSKRSSERMEAMRDRLYEGMAERGVTGEVADRIYTQLAAFANFGFPESHAVSFAYIVYSSAWLKLHYPAPFLAALLNAQPMGFYSPQTLVADARRHGVVVHGPDLNASAAQATLETGAAGSGEGTGSGPDVRLGVESVRTIGADLAERIAAGRPYARMEDVVRGCGLTQAQMEALATAGAFGCFALDRRPALWTAGAVAQAHADRLARVVTGDRAPTLPGMTAAEEAAADLWATGVSPTSSPAQFARDHLDGLGVTTAAGLRTAPHGETVLVAGVVTHRQRPATARGTTFINLEDETGLVNVICSKDVWRRYRKAATSSPALLIQGRLERAEGVINVIAGRIDPLELRMTVRSRDFH